MNYPIQLHDYNGRKIINTREPYAFLRSKLHFANWLNSRLRKLNLIENKDYVVFDNEIINSGTQGGRPQISFGLTIDAAERILWK